MVTGCQENEACSKVLNFLERLDDRIRCTQEETDADVEPSEDIGRTKSLGCIFSEEPADRTNAFKLKISSLTDFYDVLFQSWTDLSQKHAIRSSKRVTVAFYSAFFNIHPSGALTALFSCYMAGAT